MRKLFIVLEQQRASRDAAENLGPPDQAKMQARAKARAGAMAAGKKVGKTEE
jgi:hypothetical protein